MEEQLHLQGLGHEIEFKYLDRSKEVPSWFLNFQSAPLIRCSHCHISRGLGETYGKINICVMYIE
jgi:hypothetical protein